LQRGLLQQNPNHILNERKKIKHKEEGGQKPKPSIKAKENQNK